MTRNSVIASVVVLGAAITGASCCHAQERLSLMSILAEWRYPDSEIRGAQMQDVATVNKKGERTVPSFQCKTVMTTTAPIVEVVEYYRDKLVPKSPTKGPSSTDKGNADSGRAVTFHADTQDRALTIQIINVIESKSSTTLVISRGKAERETHIAWTRYVRF